MRTGPVLTFGCLVAALLFLTGASGGPSQTGQLFRAATEIVLLDVSVLDSQRRAVRGLTAADFEVVIDGRAQPVATFEEVRGRDHAAVAYGPLPAAAGGLDIATNYRTEGRLIVVVVDDYSLAETRADPGRVEVARKTALAALGGLAPDDFAAVVFTSRASLSEGFTQDHARLSRTVQRLTVVPEPPGKVEGMTAGDQGFCDCGACSIHVLEHAANAMAAATGRRKTVLYVSAGPVVTVPRSLIPPTSTDPPVGATRQEHCAWQRLRAMESALRSAQAANVRIDAVDPSGIQLGRHAPKATTTDLVVRAGAQANPVFETLEDPVVARQEALRALADATGGRAILNNNEPYSSMGTLMTEGASYYLLGIQRPVGTAGSYHRVQVRVRKPGIQASTREGYYDTSGGNPAAPSRLLDDALAGPLPSAAFPLRLATSSAAIGADRVLSFVLALGDESDRTGGHAIGDINIAVNLVDPETMKILAARHLQVSATPQRLGAEIEVLSRLRVPPGRHELRVAAQRGHRAASIFTTVEIPDFNTPLALSGPVLLAHPGPIIDRDSTDPALLEPFTSRRTFKRTEEVLAVLRIYRQEAERTAGTVTSRVLDADGRVIASDGEDISASSGSVGTPAEYKVALPVASMPAGEYVLAIDVRAGQLTESRRVRFRVE